jgi:hypothetical protein
MEADCRSEPPSGIEPSGLSTSTADPGRSLATMTGMVPSPPPFHDSLKAAAGE